MRKNILAAIIILMGTLSNTGYAGSQVQNGKIEAIMVDRDFGGLVFVKLDQVPSPKPCAGHSYQYVFDIKDPVFGDMTYSALLALYLSGGTAKFIGTGECESELNAFEYLDRFELKN